jgi:uncharacterized membrane protein YcaP (DUF421 family)
MKKEEIHLSDIMRILFGQAPPIFLLEVFIRTLLIYLILILVMRWLGKRMSGQLTIMELAVMLTLGAIVSVPMQMPDRGIIQGVVLLLCALAFQRGVSLLGFRSGKIEDTLQGKSSLLVKNGILQLDQMRKDRITKQQIFSKLRQENIFNLGTVERIYLEACGLFSIYKTDEPRAGLPVLPPDDQDIYKDTKQAELQTPQRNALVACTNCGYAKPKEDNAACENCGENNWVNAVN